MTAVTHFSITLRFQDWREMLQRLVARVEIILREELLFEKIAPKFNLDRIQDNFGNLEPGYSFVSDERNCLPQNWLYEAVSSGSTGRLLVDERGEYQVGFMKTYLDSNRLFLRLLAVLIYMTSGLPPRQDELVSITWKNWDTARNIYVSHGLVAIITSYHKAQWRVGTRPVARFLPPVVGRLLVRYLVLVPSFVQFLHRCMGTGPLHAFLFSDGEEPWGGSVLAEGLKQQTRLLLGQQVSSRPWRHIAIAIDRRVLQGLGCQVYGVSKEFGLHAEEVDEDEDRDEYGGGGGRNRGGGGETATHLQASHTAAVGNQIYGNDVSIRWGMTDTLLISYREVSIEYRDVYIYSIAEANMER